MKFDFLPKTGSMVKAFLTFSGMLLSVTFSFAQEFEWVKSMGGNGTNNSADKAWRICTDNSGAIYVTGNFEKTANFGNKSLTAAGEVDAFLAKYDPNGSVLWAIQMGGAATDEGRGVAVDDSGNVYLVGSYMGTADFGQGQGSFVLTAAGKTDIFLAKYDTEGKCIWVKGWGAGETDRPYAIAVDKSNKVYISGLFNGSVDFDPGPGQSILTSSGNLTSFLCKYDADGNYSWGKAIPKIIAHNITTDNIHNVYATGEFEGAVDFNPGGVGGAIPTFADADIFLVKYDSAGVFAWAKGAGGNGGDAAYSVVADEAQNVFISGCYALLGNYADFNFGGMGGMVNNVPGGIAGIFSNWDMFLAKYDKDGNFKFVKSIGGKDNEESNGLSLDRKGNVYMIGNFMKTVDFDPGPDSVNLTAAAGFDIFLAKYDADGKYLSVTTMPGDNDDRGICVKVDAHGNVYGAGYYRGSVDFNAGGANGKITTVGNYDGYLFKFMCKDTSSSLQSAVECGGSYTLNSQTYTTTGIYKQYFANTAGCDSILTLDLILSQITRPVINVDGFILGVTGSYVTYQWVENDATISGATDSTLSVTENGKYQVIVTNEHGCTDTSDVYIVNNVGVDDTRAIAGQIYLYPNPASAILHISTPVQVNVLISSLEGRRLLYKENVRDINISHLAAGAYFVHFKDKDGRLIKVEKIVIR